MTKQFNWRMLVFLVLTTVVSGCGSASKPSFTLAQNPVVARQVIDNVYAGSLAPMKAQLDQPLLRGNPDRLTAAASAALTRQFGTVKDMKLQAVQGGPMSSATAIWAVTGTIGTYYAKVTVDGSSHISGLWFRSSSARDWVPSHIVGINYIAKPQGLL